MIHYNGFYNEFDLIKFLNKEDGRLMIIKNFLICNEDIKFNNKVHRKGRKIISCFVDVRLILLFYLW